MAGKGHDGSKEPGMRAFAVEQRESSLMDWGFKPGKEAGEKEEAGLCLPHCSSYCSCQFRAVLCGLLLPSALPYPMAGSSTRHCCMWMGC